MSWSPLPSLVNPDNPNAQVFTRETQAATNALSLRIEALEARTDGDIAEAFPILVERQASELAVTPDPFFIARREQIVALTDRYAIPAIYPFRWFPDVGGLMSYGASPVELTLQMGIYTGKILRREGG
jgi:putative tryptophan/tyrosine transport system substrate-binding protein